MVRVHNDIVAKLRRINPRWRGERLYQETRRIVGALWQHIIYNEYLPIILGPDLIRRYGLQLQRVGFSRGSYTVLLFIRCSSSFSVQIAETAEGYRNALGQHSECYTS